MTDQKNNYYQIHCYRLEYLFNKIVSLKLPQKSKVLDVGCYPLYLTEKLEQTGFDVYGISSSHEKIKHAKIFILNAESQKLPFPEHSFDLIIFSEVLEHFLYSPVFFFRQARRLLKPGGYFLITTPNAIRFQNLIKLMLGKNIYFPLSHLFSPIQNLSLYFRHNREYTKNEIISLLKKSGFTQFYSEHFISYPPNRPKNKSDALGLKVVKIIHYCLMSLFPGRRDTILVLARI